MTEIIILCLAAFITSSLTFFTGAGLGTILIAVIERMTEKDMVIRLEISAFPAGIDEAFYCSK
jgi:hypothetical protein